MVNSRKRLAMTLFFPLSLRMIGFANVIRQPRFDSIHTVGVVQLLSSGVLFGIALFSLILILRGKRAE
jgi:hypothetical protein